MPDTHPTKDPADRDYSANLKGRIEASFKRLTNVFRASRFAKSRFVRITVSVLSVIPRSGTVLIAIGFVVGALTLILDYYYSSSLNDLFLKTTPFQLYALGVICQTVFGAMALGSMAPLLWSLKRFAWRQLLETLLWSALFAILIYSSKFFAVSCPVYSFRNHGFKTNSLTVTVGSVALLAGVGSILVNISLREMLADRRYPEIENANSANDAETNNRKTEEVDAQRVRRYLDLRRKLLHFLSVVGILLGLVGVTQSAKKNMILASTPTDETRAECEQHFEPIKREFEQCKANGLANCTEQLKANEVLLDECKAKGFYCETSFDWKKVLVYGLYYTVILVLTFLPTFSTLIATGHKLRDEILPMPSPHSESWSSDCEKRAKLEKLLSLSMTEGLRAIVAVLAPILGTLISLLGLFIR